MHEMGPVLWATVFLVASSACSGRPIEFNSQAGGKGGTESEASGGAGTGGATPASGGDGTGGATPASGGGAGAPNPGSGGSIAPGRWGNWDDAAAGRTPAACNAIADAVATESPTGHCTAVVRLGYESLALLGHTFVCSPAAHRPDEAEARAQASADATFPLFGAGQSVGAGEGTLRSVPEDPEWLFYKTPGDFGGIAAVSASTGRTVFAGTIVWAGTGKILLPTTWSTTDIGSGCAPADGSQAVRGLNLDSMAEFEPARIAALVLDSVLPTLFRALGGGTSLPFVLMYPRSVGFFDPKTAEYIVFLDAFTAGG